MTAQGFTAAELDTLARIEAAPEAPESLRERVARALWIADRMSPDTWAWSDNAYRRRYLRLATAALAVIRPDQGVVR